MLVQKTELIQSTCSNLKFPKYCIGLLDYYVSKEAFAKHSMTLIQTGCCKAQTENRHQKVYLVLYFYK